MNEARWSAILQAASEEFYEKGFRAARLQDIAARVGLLAGSLYYYIDSKEDLLFALVDRAHRQGITTTVEDEQLQTADAPTRLRAFIDRYMKVVENMTTPPRLLQWELSHLNTEHRAQVEAMRHRLHQFVRGIVRQGVDDGAFDADIDPAVATNSLFELLHGTHQWFRTSGRMSYADLADWYATLFLHGMANPISKRKRTAVDSGGHSPGPRTRRPAVGRPRR